MDDLERFCCQNAKCELHGVRGAGNIGVRAIYKTKDGHQRLLYCRVCKKKFSETRGTVFFDSHLPREKVIAVVEHLVEGTGIRKTGRLVKTNRKTVLRYAKLAGKHAEKLHDERVAFSPKHEGSSVRRKVGLRSKEGKKLQGRQPG